jgi:tRNA pseudouridine38-40 synthase
MRIALGLEYDGSAFCGWQSQAGGGSVQDALELALAQVAAAPVRVHCAGRTDAGVHASGQVVHFDTESSRPLSAWVRGTNAHLPPPVAVLWSRDVSGDFHARYCAQARAYRYRLLNRAARPGREHGHLGWYHRPLDLTAMRAGAGHLLGTHDFSSFRAAECQARSPTRTLSELRIECQGDVFEFHLRADGFLHHMVRNIVGALIYVGNGRHPPEWIAEVLRARERSQAAPTFAAAGLCFLGPEYPSHFALPVGGGRSMPEVGAGGTAISGERRP